VTVQDLRPNSQDTSAFYLGNIFELLADPNATRTLIPSSVSKPPPFSPPGYAIWVNSLWFLSLVISLTCALLATSLQQWSRRYIRVAQPARCSPEKRARMRAFFAEGVDKMHIPWAVEGLPTLLHLSVFLFFGGLVVFLFNVNHAVFSSVILWIGLFSIMYGLITVMPIVRHDSPYYAPLSRSAWFLYAGMNYVFFKVLAYKYRRSVTFESWLRFSTLKERYHGWMLGGVEKAAEETVSERSSEIDIRIFDWTIGVLEEDDSLEKFLEAIPGFFRSKLVNYLESDLPEDILNKLWSAMNRFMNRTLSSNSVIESVKTRRATICRDIMNMIPFPITSLYDSFADFFDQAPVSIERRQATARWRIHALELAFDAIGEDSSWEKFFEVVPGFFDSEGVDGLEEHLPYEFRIKFSEALNGFLDRSFSIGSVTESLRNGRFIVCLNAAHAALGSEDVFQILWDILSGRWPELLRSLEMGHSLQRWGISNDERFTLDVRRIVAKIVVGVRERDDRWISLVKAEYDIEERVLRDYIGHGDNVLFSILLHMTRQALHTGSWTPWILSSLSEFNVRDTLPVLQHDFCALWNDIVLEAWNQEGFTINSPVWILREVRHAYIALHDGTDATLTEFSASTYYFDPVLAQPSSYQPCKIDSHRQSSTTHSPVTGSLILPSPLTQLDQSPTALPRRLSTILESVHTPDSSPASQQNEEEFVTVELPSSTDYTPDPSHTQGFTSPPRATTHAASGSFITESITWNPDLFVPRMTSHVSCQSAPSAAEIPATNFVRSDDPTPQIHTSDLGETSHAPVVPSLLFQHLDFVPATITPSTGPDPGNDPDTPQDATSSATLSHPLEDNQQDEVTSRAAPDISEIPSTVIPIPRSIPTIVVSDSPSPPILLPALSSGMTTTELPLFVEPAPIQPDQIPYDFRFPSSTSATPNSHISPQVTSAFDVQVTSSIVTPNRHDDAHDLNPPIPMTVLPHSNQTALPVHDIVASTLPLEDKVSHDLDTG
jgi:hypothetical protein